MNGGYFWKDKEGELLHHPQRTANEKAELIREEEVRCRLSNAMMDKGMVR